MKTPLALFPARRPEIVSMNVLESTPDQRDPDQPEVVRAALAHLEAGRRVVPVPRMQKGPVIEGWGGLRLNADDVRSYFTADSNLGVILGEPSGWLVDVDLDCPDAVELAEKYLPPTAVISGRRSRPRSHRWYIAAGATSRQLKDPVTGDMIVELRSTGLQTLVGPSVHPSGETYDLLVGEPAVVDAQGLLEAVKALHAAVVQIRHPETALDLDRLSPMQVFARPDNAAWSDGADIRRRAIAYLHHMPAAVSGHGGHGRTYAAATVLVHGFGIQPNEAMRILLEHFNPRCDPPWSEKELRHKVEDAATKPHGRPFGWLRDAPRTPTQPPPTNPAVSAAPADSSGMARGPKGRCTDLVNAERFAANAKDSLRFCHATGRWLAWDGRRWGPDDGGTPMRVAAETARAILREASDASAPQERAELAKFAIESESRHRLDAMVALARSQPALIVRVADLDADPWLFNVANGTLDLRSALLRPHDQGDLITKFANVAFDAAATCPIFMAFLDRIFAGNKDLIGFMQRYLGMCLTGIVQDEVFPILYGEGANGKSVLLGAVRHVMGEYATDAPPTLLIESKQREHPTEIADLCGRRFVVASETEDGAVLKLQLVKRLTGEKMLKGRFMHKDYFEFTRTHKLILMTNNLPQVRENTEAVWRRLRLVPFDVVIPAEKRDTSLSDKLAKEASGILAWLVRGCLEWQASGLGEPDPVVEATAAYRSGEDHLGRFIEGCFQVDPGPAATTRLSTPWSAIRQRYEAWAASSGELALSTQQLATALSRRGFPTKTMRRGADVSKVRLRLALRPEGGIDDPTTE